MKKVGKVWMWKSPFKGGKISQRVTYEQDGKLFVRFNGKYCEVEPFAKVYPYDPSENRMVERQGYRILPFDNHGNCHACCGVNGKEAICPFHKRPCPKHTA